MTTLECCDLTGPYAYDLNVQILWILSVADVNEPTEAEIATGVDLQASYNLTDIVGWEVETDVLHDGQWSNFRRQRIGPQDIDDARLVFAADRDGFDIRTLIARGDPGYIVILPSGPYLCKPFAPMNVYPVKVAQITQLQRLRDGGGSKITVRFAITQAIGENVFAVVS